MSRIVHCGLSVLRSAAAFALLTAVPAAAQQADPTGVWEGRWVSNAEHYVEGGSTPRQLRHKGFLEARFKFCVSEDGSIGGSGRARVRREDVGAHARVFDSGTSACHETFEPSEAEVPVKVSGQRRAEEFLLRLETGTLQIQQNGVCSVPGAASQSWSNAFSAPAVWFVLFAGATTNPIVSGLTVPADDGEKREVSGSDVHTDSDAPTRGIVEHSNRLQIRRPRNAAHELPILLGQVFPSTTHSVGNNAEPYPSGERKLEAVLPDLKAALDGSSGEPRCGRPAVRVVVGGEPDDLFLEALNRARRDQLKNWFRSRGVDVDRVDWQTAFGPADDVQVSVGP